MAAQPELNFLAAASASVQVDSHKRDKYSQNNFIV